MIPLPTREQILQAITIYLKHAYGGDPPASIQELLPAEPFDPVAWIEGDQVERDPPSAPLEIVRSVAFRLGNVVYPHMKLRLSRPPQQPIFLFSVDSHDAVLKAKPGTPDHTMLEELKAHNAKISEAILTEWDTAGLPTERNYLRTLVEQTRKRLGPKP